jgi:hypothetical protein
MKPGALARILPDIIPALLCLCLGGASFFLANGLIGTAEDYRSPLAESPPTSLSGQAPRVYEPIGAPPGRLVWILVDALSYDTAMDAALMPELARLRGRGAWAMAMADAPTYSQTTWGVLLTGAGPGIADAPLMNVDPEDLRPMSQENIFGMAKASGLVTGIAGFHWFATMVPEAHVDFGAYTEGEDDEADQSILEPALAWIEGEAADFILIHLDQVDWAGHHSGAGSREWDDAAARADAIIARVASALDLSSDTLVVCSDHGQIRAGGHGGPDPECRRTPLLIVGARVTPGQYGDVRQVDFAPTIAALLGMGAPASAEGRPLLEMLNLPAEDRASLSALKAIQSDALEKALPAPAPRMRTALIRGLKTAIAAIILIAPLAAFLIIKRKDRGARAAAYACAASALGAALIFHLLYAFALDLAYSISWVRSAADLILRGAGLGALCALMAGLIGAVSAAREGLPRASIIGRAGSHVMAAAWAGLGPYAAYLAWHGPGVPYPLPDMGFWFMAVLSGVHAMGAGASILILLPLAFLIRRRALK